MSKDIAIVMGYKGVNSTGLVRSLGQAGYRVIFASSYSPIESKYVCGYWYLPPEEQERIDILCNHLLKLPTKPALFTGDDDTAAFIDCHLDRLTPLCFCPNAGGNLLRISDKAVMAQMAKNVGLPIPQTQLLTLDEDIACPLNFPVILKPYAGYAGKKADIQICRDNSEYFHSVRYLLNSNYSKVLIQQLLEGKDLQDLCLMGFSLPNGTVHIPCTIRKIRSYPLKQGSLSFGQVENNLIGTAMEPLKELVRQTGYVGIFDIDMMLCDQIPYFIEINYRNGQNGYVSTAAGCNLPANWFRGMQGHIQNDYGLLKPLYFMDERNDRKHINLGNISKDQWKDDRRRASVFSLYCKDDIRPFIHQYIRIPERWRRKPGKTKMRNLP